MNEFELLYDFIYDFCILVFAGVGCYYYFMKENDEND